MIKKFLFSAIAVMALALTSLFGLSTTATAAITCEVTDVSGFDVNAGVHVEAYEIRDASGFATVPSFDPAARPDCMIVSSQAPIPGQPDSQDGKDVENNG